MSKIDTLISQLCPDGVKRVRLDAIIEIYTGVQFNKSDMQETGSYPVINGGINPSGYIEQFNEEANTITISQGGASAGYINYLTTKFWAGAHCFVVKPNEQQINKRFLYHYLKNSEYSLQHTQQGAGIPSVNRDTIRDISIPLPPLLIQEEIVKILDRFAVLTAELEAELEARRKQYEYYRTLLLDFSEGKKQAYEGQRDPRTRLLSFDSVSSSDSVRWKALGEVGCMLKGNGILKSDFTETGIPCIHYGQVHTKFHSYTDTNITFVSEDMRKKCKFAHTGDLIIATTSEDVEACCKAVAWLGEEDVAVSGDAHIFRHNQNPKYISYLFQTDMFAEQKRKVATGAKVVRVHGEDILKFKFAFPSLEKQAEIVECLDCFEQLIYGVKDSIPALIDDVQKQYEFYRNKLLTFPE